MAITARVLAQVAGSRPNASFDVALTAAPDPGEYVVVDVSHSYDGAFVDTVTGYSALADSGALTAYTPRRSLHARFAGAGEAASVTVVKGGTTNVDYDVIVIAFSNVDTADPLAVDPVFASGGQASGTAPSGTPDAGSAPWLAVWSLGHQNYRAAADSEITWTGATEVAQAVSSFCIASVATEARTDTTATGTRAWSVTPWGGNTPSAVVVYGLREATPPPPPSGPEPGRMLLAV